MTGNLNNNKVERCTCEMFKPCVYMNVHTNTHTHTHTNTNKQINK